MRVTAPKHGNEAKRNPAKRIECEHCAFRKMFSPFRNANRTALVPCSTRSGPVSPSPCQPSRGTLFCATEGFFFCGGDVMTCSGWNAFQMLRFAVQTQKTLKDSVFFLAFPLRQASVGRCWNATLFYGKAKKCCSCLLRIENMTSVLASWFFFPRFFSVHVWNSFERVSFTSDLCPLCTPSWKVCLPPQGCGKRKQNGHGK